MDCPNCGEPHDRRQPCPGHDPAVEAELGRLPGRADDGDGPFCPECGIEPSLNDGRCWRCRGESTMEAGA
jgi:hypothetical protein